jgi:NAD(P)-dependent dehydrogenase (short-subunit alcohol dehydrogenase family)
MATVVITGSTQGIGRGLAVEFCRQGHQVAIAGRNGARIEETLDTLSALPGKAIGRLCDVSKVDEVQSLWDTSVAEFGSVDIWINNAGLARTIWPVLDVPQADMETMIQTNMLGTINGSRIACRGMLEQGSGKLFNMLGGGSDGEYFPGMGLYGTTKRGLNYMTDALIKELADSPLIIGKIRPGLIITEAVIREASDDLENFQKSRSQMNNLVDTVETVSPFLVEKILATDKSGTKIRWMTGGKISARMIKGMFKKRPDQFEAFGL